MSTDTAYPSLPPAPSMCTAEGMGRDQKEKKKKNRKKRIRVTAAAAIHPNHGTSSGQDGDQSGTSDVNKVDDTNDEMGGDSCL